MYFSIFFFYFQHINVILYYLSKKAKYDVGSTYSYTMIDCLFMTKISMIRDNYADIESDKSFIDEERVVGDYIKGYILHAAIPWHTVDHVFIPVHVKGEFSTMDDTSAPHM